MRVGRPLSALALASLFISFGLGSALSSPMPLDRPFRYDMQAFLTARYNPYKAPHLTLTCNVASNTKMQPRFTYFQC